MSMEEDKSNTKVSPEELVRRWELDSFQLFTFPKSLFQISLEAFGKYISDLLVQLVTFPQYTEVPDHKKHYIEQTCKYLDQMIQRAVPPSLCNEVTKKLLHYVNMTYEELYWSNYSEWLEEIAQIFVSAILHPSVSVIECFEDKTHPRSNNIEFTKLPFLIIHAIHKLKNLKILRLGHSSLDTPVWFGKCVSVPETLEEFSSEVCNDRLLKTLSRTCKKLKVLDIESSEVSDAGVQSILEFRHLELLSVDFTSISEEGLTNMLNGLTYLKVESDGEICNTSELIKSISCHNLDSHHLNLLAEKFTNITSLILTTNVEDEPLDPLKTLKNLTKLTLKSCRFHTVKEMLQEIGLQLLYLHMDYVDVDLWFIAFNCPFLKCLHLELEQYYPEYPTDLELPEFPSLECLYLNTCHNETAHIVSRCVNVKNLYIMHGRTPLFKSLLTREKLKKLEYVYWKAGYPDAIEIQFCNRNIILTVVDHNKGTTCLRCAAI